MTNSRREMSSSNGNMGEFADMDQNVNVFAGMDQNLNDQMVTSPLSDHLDIASMFPISNINQQFGMQEPGMHSFNQGMLPRLDTGFHMSYPGHASFPDSGVVDRIYGKQQDATHGRQYSIPSPSFIIQDEVFSFTPSPDQYVNRDFVNGGQNNIYIEGAEPSAMALYLDLEAKVQKGYNVQRLPNTASNMDGVSAVQISIADLCKKSNVNPPTQTMLLTYLAQQVSKVHDGSAPQVHEAGIDRPLILDHLLMMIHQYGLRVREQYNVGVIRPRSEAFGAFATYTISWAGPGGANLRTIWLYEEAGRWHPLVPNDFNSSVKTYADALRGPATPIVRRPVTPTSSNILLRVPSLISPSTQDTRSETGSDITGITGNTGLSCGSCGRQCDDPAGLAHHIRNHRPRNLMCSYVGCGRTFLYNKDLKRHVKTHIGKDLRMEHSCSVGGCGKTYTRADNLRRHQRQDHPGFEPAPSVASSRYRGARHSIA